MANSNVRSEFIEPMERCKSTTYMTNIRREKAWKCPQMEHSMDMDSAVGTPSSISNFIISLVYYVKMHHRLDSDP